MTKKAILILSGGIDSVTLLYKLIKEKIEVHCILFNYNQIAQKELEYGVNICEKLNVDYTIINLKKISEKIFDINNVEDIYSRNTIFIEMSTAYAITHNYSKIYIGLISPDPAVPDTSFKFIRLINDLHKFNNNKYIPVIAPLHTMTKKEVLEIAYNLEVPLNETWSCYYNNKYECGICEGCKSKNEAIIKFKEEVENDLNIYNNPLF